MDNHAPSPIATDRFASQWPALVVWALGWLCMLLLDGELALGSLAMLLVLSAAVGALWLRPFSNAMVCLVCIVAFNWLFVPPRHAFAIDLRQDAILLLVMFAVSVLVTMLMASLRGQTRRAALQARAIDRLRRWGDSLRDANDVIDCLPALRLLLSEIAGVDVTVFTLRAELPEEDDMQQVVLTGEADAEQVSALWHSLRSGYKLGAGSGRYPQLPQLYLPMRGKNTAWGAVLVADAAVDDEIEQQLQAVCDQTGAALERQHWQQQQRLSDQSAREQRLRATLLTAIAHDYRTPLATIMGSASAIEEQDARLTQRQRQELAHRIVDEASRLRNITANILELARLDTPGVQLQCDWQTAEELAAGALKRCREPSRLQLEVEPGLPLLWCDSLLVSQLLDNLIDNACKYSPPASKVRLAISNAQACVVFRVYDHGSGIPAALQQQVFQPFHQGEALIFGGRSGVGLGLALCRIVASVHGGELGLQSSAQGSCFEFRLPHRQQPAPPVQETAGGQP